MATCHSPKTNGEVRTPLLSSDMILSLALFIARTEVLTFRRDRAQKRNENKKRACFGAVRSLVTSVDSLRAHTSQHSGSLPLALLPQHRLRRQDAFRIAHALLSLDRDRLGKYGGCLPFKATYVSLLPRAFLFLIRTLSLALERSGRRRRRQWLRARSFQSPAGKRAGNLPGSRRSAQTKAVELTNADVLANGRAD